ncbi:PREDICTED: probable serine hydrolase isoform X1 [Dufourea novaeangliae]|uniref:Putative serine hydrolase n=2 Tax=Dufourea novaeangliae TaxID=178035 RepID=A0A154PN38_DUFNO|nr:PREDICTED: probable serine hydrolase isoform X1 [Dufourea novaeangliae]KZC13295.1 putative serine hydrolase [Dufourea novaeangliae]
MNTDTENITSADNINKQKPHNVEEVTIPVPWGHISGKWWGPMDQQPIIALHGWQDNCGSFDTLIPLLPSDIAILTLDLFGHGCSTDFPIGQFCNIVWDGLLTLRRIVKYYRWNKVKLIGHSLGGVVSFLYSATYPDEVDFIISLDIAGPNSKDVSEIAAATGDTIDKYLSFETLNGKDSPDYTYEEMLHIIEGAYNGSITRESAIILMKRGIRPSYDPERFCFSRDSRLKVATLGMPSMDLLLAFAARVKCAYLNIRASDGLKYEKPEHYHMVLDRIKVGAKRFEYHEVEGSHHVHLNNPERVASIINKFIST